MSQLYQINSGDEDGNAQTEEAEEKQGGRPPVMMAKKGQPAAKKGATAGKGENGNLGKLKQLAQKFYKEDTGKGVGKKGGGKKGGGKCFASVPLCWGPRAGRRTGMSSSQLRGQAFSVLDALVFCNQIQ